MGNKEKERVLTIKGVCEELECSRQWYYLKYRAMLTPIPTTTSEILYKEKDVLELKAIIENEKDDKPYQVVK